MRNSSGNQPAAFDRTRKRLKSIAVLVAAVSIGLIGQGAAAAGKPEKAEFESKFHLMIPGLRSSLSRATGNQLWIEHARDVRVLPGLQRYAQNVPLPLYDLRSSFDSVSDIWFNDFEAAKAGFASDETRLGAFVWMSRFTGGPTAGQAPWRPNGGGMVIVKDHVIVDGYEQGYKWINFMRRKEGVSNEKAQAYLRETYAAKLAKLPGIRRYVLGLTYRPKGADAAGGLWAAPQKWDAVDMIWFESLDDMLRLLGSYDYQESVLQPAEAAVVDQSQTISFAVEYNERVPFPPRYQGPSWDEIKPAPRGAK